MHFLTVVFFQADTLIDRIEDLLNERLERFNEKREVTAYRVQCDCVNGKASSYGYKFAELNAPQTMDWYREQYNEMPFDKRPEWREFIKGWWEVRETAEMSHELYQKPDPECPECLGGGKSLTTYNPDSKWDWWRIGGRWDGELVGNPQSSDNGFNFHPRHQTVKNNMMRVSDLREGYAECYAMLTVDGRWIDRDIREEDEGYLRGKYVGQIPEDEWTQRLKEVFAEHSDCFAIACDMHI